MAVFGSPFGAGFGSPDAHLAFFDALPMSGGASIIVTMTPADGFGDAYFAVYVNSVKASTVYIGEGATGRVTVPTTAGTTRQNVTVLRIGHSAYGDAAGVARIYDGETADSLTVEWDWPYEIHGVLVDGDIDTSISSVDIDDITWPMLFTVAGFRTRGDLAFSMTVAGGNATITISDVSGVVVSTGTGAVGSTVTMIGIVSGTIDVDAGAASETGKIRIRYPKSMGLLANTSSPPSTSVGSSAFGQTTRGTYTIRGLAAGTYYVALRPVSDTGDIAAQGAAATGTVVVPPVAPTDLAYDSGDASATVITWTGSTTVGATYNIYVQEPDDLFLDTSSPFTTAAAGEESKTLPAISGYAGTAYVLIRAEFGGVEENNGSLLKIEYDAAGAYVDPRPNTITIRAQNVSSGTALTAYATYDTTGERGTATTAQLFTRTPTGSYDFDTPDDTATLSSASGRLKFATLTATLANGWHWITAKAATSTGQQSASESQEILVYVSDVDAVAPTPTVTASGG
jgi:hypothetical protein